MRPRLLSPLAALAVLGSPGAARAADPIMPLAQVSAGMSCTGYTVIQGTTISSFAVQTLGVFDEAGAGARILVSVSGPAVAQTGVAEGFSGSPVYCPGAGGDPEVIGAISEGVGAYGNTLAAVTPIESMLAEPVDPPSDLPMLGAVTKPLLGPLSISGLSPAIFGIVEQAGIDAGRRIVSAPASAGATAGGPGYPIQPLVPGASVAVSYAEGAIAVGAVGTVTYVNGSTVYAFGHELDGAGRRSLLLQTAYVDAVIPQPDPAGQMSYKLASPGQTVGTLTSDTPNAVIGRIGPAPRSIPVHVIAKDLDTGHSLTLDSAIADETDIGDPLGTSLLGVIAPAQIAQAAVQVYNGAPADESGVMCLQVRLREAPQPLAFCNRYVGIGGSPAPPNDPFAGPPPPLASGVLGDATAAFNLLGSVQFARLHVTGVTAVIDAQRGLLQARIISARAPLRVRAGQTVRVRLLVQLYRGARRALSFALRIPPGLSGPVLVHLKGPSAAGGPSSQALASALSSALGGGPSSPTAGPPSFGALRRQFARIPRYDGLQMSVSGRPARHVYRDPSLLILGTATLRFSVG